MMKPGVWTNGTDRQTGRWEYYRPSDSFTIILDSKDPVTGQQRKLTTYRDTPEWGNWKLEKEPKIISVAS